MRRRKFRGNARRAWSGRISGRTTFPAICARSSAWAPGAGSVTSAAVRRPSPSKSSSGRATNASRRGFPPAPKTTSKSSTRRSGSSRSDPSPSAASASNNRRVPDGNAELNPRHFRPPIYFYLSVCLSVFVCLSVCLTYSQLLPKFIHLCKLQAHFTQFVYKSYKHLFS